MHINTLGMSDHASKRTRQRGIRKNFVDFVLDEADRMLDMGFVHDI